MLSKNILIFVGALVLVGIVVYFYYNHRSPSKPAKKESKKEPKKKHKKTKSNKKQKKVQFNSEVEYNEYTINSPVMSQSEASDGVDIDSIIDESGQFDVDFGENQMAYFNIIPSNLDMTKSSDTWDSSFGLPLMNKEEKKDYFNRMQKNFQKYGKALDNFYNYQTDRNTVITTETTIDPFKPDHRSASLKGQTVKEIFDAQVSGPKAKPKPVKKRTANQVIYEDEDVMNGGTVPGTNYLHGFEGYSDNYKSAIFGNEF